MEQVLTPAAIPAYPEFVRLGLDHKSGVDRLFARSEPDISEYTFTNLFMWRDHYRVSLSRQGEILLFLARPAGRDPFFFPPWGNGGAAQAVRDCLDPPAKKDGALAAPVERVPQSYLDRHASALAGLATVRDPANDDYVYSAADLINLPGRKYDGKRNAIRKFAREYRFEYRPLDEQLAGLCLEFQDYWCNERRCVLTPGLVAENMAVREALTNFNTLGVKGGAILIDGHVEAFSLGERLNSRTFVVHIEKANPNIPGLYAVINQQFAGHEASAFEYINREQDLGDEGLRKAKLSYEPAFMVKKHKIMPGPGR